MGADPPASVMVAVRCRPFNSRERAQEEGKIVVIKEKGYAALMDTEDKPREFSFDYTYDDDSIQEDVYMNLGRPMLDKVTLTLTLNLTLTLTLFLSPTLTLTLTLTLTPTITLTAGRLHAAILPQPPAWRL